MELLEILRIVNFVLTPLAAVTSILLVFYAVRALKQNKDPRNEIVGVSMIGVGSIFLIRSMALNVIYTLIFTGDDRGTINLISNLTNTITLSLIVVIGIILINIYKNRL